MFDIEFNPKENFLKEQLETSGLEMKLFGIGAGAENRRRVKEENKQQKKLNKQAKANYKYELEVFEAGKKDYFAQRDFEFETALKQYDYNVEIQDYSYGQALARYEKDLGIYEAQLGYNEDAFGLAISDQEAALQDLGLQQAFQREAIYADLENEIINQGLNRESQEVKLETIKTGFENELTNLGFDKLQQQANLFGIQSNRPVSYTHLTLPTKRIV